MAVLIKTIFRTVSQSWKNFSIIKDDQAFEIHSNQAAKDLFVQAQIIHNSKTRKKEENS